MGDTEEYFPRGGKKPTVTYFKPSGNFLGAAEKGERKKQKLKKKSEGDDGYLSDEIVAEEDLSSKNCAMSLNYKIVKEGQILLGRVWQILETKVNISLPCRLLGTVMACHISEPYNKVLEAYVNDQREEMGELNKMFQPGQYVAVRILEVKNSNLMLSMMPQHVNNGRSQTELHRGAILQAAVSSVEDHGYIMDIGISNTRAFLPKSAINPEVLLDIGALTWCCVKSLESENSVVTLSNELEALQKAVQRHPTSSLLPATPVEFTVDKSLENGIEGHVFQNTTAYVQRHQVEKIKGKKPKLGQRIRARVLYVMPTRHTPFLTMKNIFESTYPDLAVEQKFQVGAIIEEAQVIKIMGRSVIFKLDEGSVGTLSLRRIKVDEELTDEDVVAKSYPIGSSRRVRVLFYNLSDYIYSVSDEISLLEERYFSPADLSVGEVVDATIAAVRDDRLQLTVGRLTGTVPPTHMSDAGLYVDPKKASKSILPKKFKVGQQVKARVLNLDRDKPALALTLKPSLLSPDFEVLQNYYEAQVGKMYTGVIVQVRDYLLVSFFNSVMAYVPRFRVSSPPPPEGTPLSELYHPGQIVNCTIMKLDAENKKMVGSLVTLAFETKKTKEKAPKRRQEPEDTSVPQKKQKHEKLNAESDDSKRKQKKKKKGKNKSEEVTEDVEMEEAGKHNNEEKNEINDNNTNDNDLGNDTKKPKKKKKQQTKSVKTDNSNLDNEVQSELTCSVNENKIKNGKDLKKKAKGLTPDINTNDEPNNDTNEKNKKADDSDNHFLEAAKTKKVRKRKSKEALETPVEMVASEESDAIETDIQEDQMLTPQDLGLVDLSDEEKNKINDINHGNGLGNDTKKTKKKKKQQTKSAKINNSDLENEVQTKVTCSVNENKIKKGKNLKKKAKGLTPANNTDDEPNNDTNEKNKKADNLDNHFLDAAQTKKVRKRKSKEALETPVEKAASEESDAIETDIQDDQVLTPQDLGLVDLSDCTTAKSYKKRLVSLLKAINVKTMRIERIENKIKDIENRGLNVVNKKFHTAMHLEKLALMHRMEKLMEVLKTVQEKLKEFDEHEVKEYKKKNGTKAQNASEKMNNETGVANEKSKKTHKSKVSKLESLEAVLEVPSVKDFWSVPAETEPTAAESDLSSSEEEEADKPKKKRKKLTAAEKVAKAREEEERVRRMEKSAAEAATAPQSADHFERALLASPNSSQLWIAYMAFHLQATEIERARAVGQRALKTISFREEQEKLNVWLALLNLEHRFGTKESQQKTLEDALQMNDKYQIHSKLLDIYVETGKAHELAALVEIMLRKYKRQREMYEECGNACYRSSIPDKARQVMQKGLAALDKKEHVALLVRFARLERELGEGERSEALMEHVLAAYPQRVDVCAVYADLLLKGGDVERLRQVMERMTSQKLPARKMKVLYKKWIEVEEKIGDQEHIENIRKRALDYVEKAKF